MKTICVAGTSSGVGKTAVACCVIRHIRGCAALKITVCHEGPCPKSKPCDICSSLGGPFKIVTDAAEICRPNTDTGRLSEAGAKKVVWGQTSPDELDEAVSACLSHFGEDDLVVVEGNSFLTARDADLALMVVPDGDSAELKESALQVLDKIDFFVVSMRAAVDGDGDLQGSLVASGPGGGTALAPMGFPNKRTFKCAPEWDDDSINDEFLAAIRRSLGL